MPVDRKLDLGGTFVCHRALAAGELDLYPEYTGTAFTAILKEKPDLGSAARALARGRGVREALGHRLGAAARIRKHVRARDARRRRPEARRREDLRPRARIRSCEPGFGYEFLERADGFAGLAAAYGLAFSSRPAEMDLGLLYPALAQGKVDVVAGNSTDGLIAAMGLAVLEDDRRYFPPYEAAFVVRGAIWNDPRVRGALAPLAGAISPVAMRAMNAAVDRDRRRPAEVAAEFLASLGARRHP